MISKFYGTGIEVGAPAVGEGYGRLIVDLVNFRSVACFRLPYHAFMVPLCCNQSDCTCHLNHRLHPSIVYCVAKFNFEEERLLWTPSLQTQFG